MNARLVVRILLGLLAAVDAVIGLWATAAPMSFYLDGPFPGAGWVQLLPPYNEHLLRDFAGMNLAMALVVTVVAIKLTPLWVRVVSGALFLFAVPHTIFHVVHLEHFSAGAATAQTILLVLTTLMPVVTFLMASQLERAAAPV